VLLVICEEQLTMNAIPKAKDTEFCQSQLALFGIIEILYIQIPKTAVHTLLIFDAPS
jgi:hypothetical protein